MYIIYFIIDNHIKHHHRLLYHCNTYFVEFKHVCLALQLYVKVAKQSIVCVLSVVVCNAVLSILSEMLSNKLLNCRIA